jgi:hypothetical protein
MKMKSFTRILALAACLTLSSPGKAFEIPLVGNFDMLVGVIPLDSLLLNNGVPVLSDLPVLGGLPLIDGRGLPVARGLDESLRLLSGLGNIPIALGGTNGGLAGIGSGEQPLIEMLLSGGPTLNFLALDAVLAPQ